MENFVRHIFKKDKNQRQDGIIIQESTKVGSTQTQNNGCQTMWEGSVRVPAGVTAVMTGQITQGIASGAGLTGSNGETMFLGTRNLSEGVENFTVELGNSGQPGVANTYVLTVTTSQNETITKIFRRDASKSAFYDGPIC